MSSLSAPPAADPAITTSLHDRIIEAAQAAESAYYRLTLIVGPAGSGKSQALQRVSDERGWPLIAVGGKLAGALLDVPRRRRAIALPGLLSDLIQASGAPTILLDNTELLFEPSLAQDPLRLLQGLARSRSIVAVWSGAFAADTADTLVYGEPGHPEERRYVRPEVIVVSARKVARMAD